jgi:hypothetical protein
VKAFLNKLVIAGMVVSSTAAAQPFDGSKPLICASFANHLCSVGEHCEAQGHDDSDVPRFFRISVQDKKVTGVRPSGAKVEANIEKVARTASTMFLQGMQENLAWSVAIDEEDGTMILTASNKGNGMVVFGECIVP